MPPAATTPPTQSGAGAGNPFSNANQWYDESTVGAAPENYTRFGYNNAGNQAGVPGSWEQMQAQAAPAAPSGGLLGSPSPTNPGSPMQPGNSLAGLTPPTQPTQPDPSLYSGPAYAGSIFNNYATPSGLYGGPAYYGSMLYNQGQPIAPNNVTPNALYSGPAYEGSILAGIGGYQR
jgi:hypothetical protein